MDILNAQLKTLPLSRLVNNSGQIPGVPKNPRIITDERYRALVERLRENNLTGLKPLIVYEQDGKYIVLGGNQRLRALRELKVKEVACLIAPPDTPAKQLREAVILDNNNDGENDWEALANEWSGEELADWGISAANWGLDTEEIDAAEIERKRQEFEERMRAGEISEEDEEYQEFLEKFKLKKTTDDCYTPPVVYDAVSDWVANEYKVNKANFVRPFYPGGNYQQEKYAPEAIVVDNPPFSILAEIVNFYNEHKIRFFLFAPHLTLYSSSSSSSSLAVGVAITYENGANVNTSFVTNLEPRSVRTRTAPTLYKAVKEANDKNLKELHKELPRYSYDLHVVTSAALAPYSRLGIDFVIPRDESARISQLDAQKPSGKAIYGSGYLISERLFIEREKAEREKAEREKAERWNLSDRELAIVQELTKAKQ